MPRLFRDRVVQTFRDLYLHREFSLLHGLALVGVRAVLGLSGRGSPFNIQRSLHVPNLTRSEVVDMFDQYHNDTGQPVEQAVVEKLYDETLGQPGLVGWFGELLTEVHNPGEGRAISMQDWEDVHARALRTEPDNTIMNLVRKARGPHRDHVLEVFSRSNIEFSFDKEWCNFLYLQIGRRIRI